MGYLDAAYWHAGMLACRKWIDKRLSGDIFVHLVCIYDIVLLVAHSVSGSTITG